MSEPIDAILDFAISREQEAIDLYTNLAARSDDKYARAFPVAGTSLQVLVTMKGQIISDQPRPLLC